MSGSDEVEWHGTRKVREDGSSVVVTIPKEAIEASEVVVGEDVRVGTESEFDGIMLLPWSDAALSEMLGD